MSYMYWFVRKICARCDAPLSCPVDQQYDRSRCAACEGKFWK